MDIFSNPKKTNEGIVYYETPNATSAQPILLVHGAFGQARIWEQYIPLLTSAGYEALVMDLPGHGNSEGQIEGLGIADYVNGIESVGRVSFSKPIVIGYGMAGLLSLLSAERDITETVISIDPTPSQEVQKEDSFDAKPEVYTAYEAGMPKGDELRKNLHDVNKTALMRMQAMLEPESGLAHKEQKEGISLSKEALKEKHILFIASEHSEAVPFGGNTESTKRMAEYYGKSHHVIEDATLPGILFGGHAEEASAAMLGFLKEI